jgi:lysophospholipase L1-like esterase
MTPGKRGNRVAFRLAMLAGATLVAVIAAEAISRVLWRWQYNNFLVSQFSGYQMLDAERGVTVLRPGIRLQLQEFIALLEQHDRSMGVTLLRADAEKYHLNTQQTVFEVNQLGLLGPEAERPKPRGVVRVLSIGDSVTFGPYITKFSYPRVIERELNRLSGGEGVKHEVLNAGVQGYNIESVLKRLDEFIALEPDVITILIGWNRTILRADPKKNGTLYHHFALYRFLYHGVLDRRHGNVNMPGASENTYDSTDPIIPKLRATSFASDFEEWTTLVRSIRSKLPHCRIVALTLPGLFVEGVDPGPEAKAKAFSLAFTPNLYGWAVLTDVYNHKLSDFSDREKVDVIDVAEWSRTIFQPRSEYFVDSVHMTAEGYDLMGTYVATELLKVTRSTSDPLTLSDQQFSHRTRRQTNQDNGKK